MIIYNMTLYGKPDFGWIGLHVFDIRHIEDIIVLKLPKIYREGPLAVKT